MKFKSASLLRQIQAHTGLSWLLWRAVRLLRRPRPGSLNLITNRILHILILATISTDLKSGVWSVVNNDEIVIGLHPQLGDECQSLTLGWDLICLAPNSIFQFAFSNILEGFAWKVNQRPRNWEDYISFLFPGNSLISVLVTCRAYSANTEPFKCTHHPLVHCFQNFRETSTPSSVSCWARRSLLRQ